jgi:hypothetical protein
MTPAEDPSLLDSAFVLPNSPSGGVAAVTYFAEMMGKSQVVQAKSFPDVLKK